MIKKFYKRKQLCVNAFLFIFLITSVKLVAQTTLSHSVDSITSSPKEVIEVADSLHKARQFFKDKKYEHALSISLNLLKQAVTDNDSTQIANNTLLIADIFRKTKNYDQALPYYLSSLEIAKKRSSTAHIVSLELKVAALLYNTSRQDSAIVYLLQVANVSDTSRIVMGYKAKAYNSLSGVLGLKGDLLKAENYVYKALEIQERQGDSLSIASSLNNLASVFINQNRYRDAKRELLDGLEYLNNNNSQRAIEIRENIYNNMAWSLYKLKDYRAYTYAEKAFDLKDSLNNEEIKGVLTKIEREFNVEREKKQGEINTANERAAKEMERNERIRTEKTNQFLWFFALSILVGSLVVYQFFKLRQRNKLEQLERDVREQVLNATLDGKETERKMIAETLHNSVSTLLSSASLHLQATKMLLKENSPEEIDKAQVIVSEAGTIIRNLSHTLVSSVLLKFGLAYAIQELTEKYSNSTLEFSCDCDPLPRYESGFELKINSIIDELLNNIIKHSKASVATIKMRQEDAALLIVIKDNGKGFDLDKNLKKGGLGLSQIEARIKRMKGVFKINSKSNIGTNIYISVPYIIEES